MKTCQKCNIEFPIWMEIDGKRHNFQRRKFCLTCSPLYGHNHKNLSIHEYKPIYIEQNNDKYKLCSNCNTYFTLTHENYYITNRGTFHHYCKLCNKKRALNLQRENKLKAIEYKGGKCYFCGYNKYYGSLAFHHMDPSNKKYEISENIGKKFEKLKEELDKCILVCSNCHGELHGGLLSIP